MAVAGERQGLGFVEDHVHALPGLCGLSATAQSQAALLTGLRASVLNHTLYHDVWGGVTFHMVWSLPRVEPVGPLSGCLHLRDLTYVGGARTPLFRGRGQALRKEGRLVGLVHFLLHKLVLCCWGCRG